MDCSIVISVFNCERFIARSVRSALDQFYPIGRFEVVVVNDGSTDNTGKILDYYKDRIKIITLEERKGLAFARNEGIRNSGSRYIVCLDADDYVDNNLLFIESIFLDLNPECDAVSCDYYLVDEHEEHIKRVDAERFPIACGVMFRVERLIDVGLYDPCFRFNEEKELVIRFCGKGYCIKNIGFPLYRYRQHKNNMSKNRDLKGFFDKKLLDKQIEG